MRSEVSLSRNRAGSWRQNVTRNEVTPETYQAHMPVCAPICTHTCTHRLSKHICLCVHTHVHTHICTHRLSKHIYPYAHTHAHTDSASTCACMYTHVHAHTQVHCQMCHLLPVLESGLFQMVQTALLGVQHRPECCGERVKVTYQLRTMGKSWCFSAPLLAHFVKRRDSLLCLHWRVLCVPASSSRNRKTWHSSLQSQSNCMVRDLTHCIYFKTYKKKLYSKINMKLQSTFIL